MLRQRTFFSRRRLKLRLKPNECSRAGRRTRGDHRLSRRLASAQIRTRTLRRRSALRRTRRDLTAALAVVIGPCRFPFWRTHWLTNRRQALPIRRLALKTKRTKKTSFIATPKAMKWSCFLQNRKVSWQETSSSRWLSCHRQIRCRVCSLRSSASNLRLMAYSHSQAPTCSSRMLQLATESMRSAP